MKKMSHLYVNEFLMIREEIEENAIKSDVV